MINQWEKIDLNDYEKHMSDPAVFQLQKLNIITQKQIKDYHPSSLLFLGIAGGNGLEYCNEIENVYAIDINQKFLKACKKRFPYKNIKYILMDLNKDELELTKIDLIIANLVFEYVDEETVVTKLLKVMNEGGILSTVIQINNENTFVSRTKYSDRFKCLEDIYHDVDINYFDNILCNKKFKKLLYELYPLPNGKAFLRLDYQLGN